MPCGRARTASALGLVGKDLTQRRAIFEQKGPAIVEKPNTDRNLRPCRANLSCYKALVMQADFNGFLDGEQKS
jgi:hypothetical protein